MKAVEFITEAFDQPYPIEWEKWADGEAVDALATLDDGTNLSIMFRKEGTAFLCSDWMVEFQRNNSQEITGEGDAQRVFATVLKAIRQFVKKYKANTITFSASKDPKPEMVRVQGARANPESRANLYDSLIRRYASAMGYSAQQREGNGKVTYLLRRIKPGVAEGLDQSLSSMAGQEQAERNAYGTFVKSQMGGDYTKGQEVWAKLKNRPRNDIFGDAVRQDQFMKMKFDFDKFTDKDWGDYWVMAQHCDKNRDFQKNALSMIKKYQGTDHKNYKFLYDRISMGLTGKQKYGTQNGPGYTGEFN